MKTKRTGKQIRERYVNKLDPNIKLDKWTIQEDTIIISKFHEVGTKWSEIC